jgi:3D (Asp-Asp-Asp) domain-containing protein
MPTDVNKKPEIKLGKKLKLWSTYYYAPMYKSDPNGIPLRDKHGKSLGVKLSHKRLCNYMLQGSGLIDGVVYGWGGVTNSHTVNCTKYYSKKMVSGKLKFIKDTHVRGVENYKITPFKTIAVDQKVIPYGTKVYIPDFKGIEYQYNGKTYTHDGYVEALDTGGGIKGNHIDFYVGPAWGDIGSASRLVAPFKNIITSSKSGLFDAYIVKLEE